MVLPYSVVYNNHVPGAACLFISFVGLIAPGLSQSRQRVVLLGSGLLAGLAFAIDLPSFFLMTALAVVALVRHRRRVLWFAVPLALPILITVISNYQIHQSPLPIYFRPGVFTWEGSTWADGVAGRKPPAPDEWGLRIFDTLIGDHGLLVTWPIMIFPLAALLGQIIHRGAPYQGEGIAILGGALLLLGNFLFSLSSFGGRSYGIRYLLPIFPLLFFFAYFQAPRRWSLPRSLYWIPFGLALALSALSTVPATAQPWSNWQPLFYFQPTVYKPHVRFVTPFPARPKHTLEATIEPGMKLAGYTLTPQRTRPGDNVSITVYWQPEQVPPLAKVFLHIRSAGNQNVAQADYWILGQPLSAEDWASILSQHPTVHDEVIVTLPADAAPGTYRVLAGLYDPNTVERLAVTNDQSGENAVYLGDMVIQ